MANESMDGLLPTAPGLLITVLLLVACSADVPPDVTPLPHEVALEQDLRIDGYEQELTTTWWLGVSPGGTIALTTDPERTVRFFDAAGQPVGAVGRDGEGPGEFRAPAHGGWIGDTLSVTDIGLGRLTLIAPDLTVARTVERPPALISEAGTDAGDAPSYGAIFYPYALYPDATALFRALGSLEGAPDRLVRASLSGAVERDVAAMPSAEEGVVVLAVGNQGFVVGRVPFFPVSQWEVAPDGETVALMTVRAERDSSNVHLRVVDSWGAEVFDRTYRFKAVPIPSSVMDSAMAAEVRRRQPSQRGPMEEKLREKAPPTFPPADRLVVGSDGRIWIGLRTTAAGKPWMVVDRDGEPSALVTLPLNVRLRAADATHLYGTGQDELGVESIVRYRITSREVPGR